MMHDDFRLVPRRWGRPGGVAASTRGIAVRALLAGAVALTAATVAAAISVLPAVLPAVAAPVGADAGARDASHASISGDGRWVVFEASVPAAGTSDTGTSDDRSRERRTTFRADRLTGTTVELTPVPDGVRPGDSVRPVVSADGCVVVVHTEMPLDLFRDDDLGDRWDVYRLVVPECGGELGRWQLVSTGSDGASRDDVVAEVAASINDSGTLVAFTHPAGERRGSSRRNPSAVTNVTVVDLTVPLGAANHRVEVPAMPVEAPTASYRYAGIGEPALSGDGRFLAFTADVTASDPLPGWGSGEVAGGDATAQVYLWDRDDPDRRTRIRLVSAAAGEPDGEPAGAGASSPVVSVDGSVVAFVSADPELTGAVHPGCTPDGCPTQVIRWESTDDGAAVMTIVSATEAPGGIVTAGDRASWSPALDRNGDQVTFVSRASNLLPTSVPLGSGPGGGVADVPVGDVPVGDVPVGDVPVGDVPVGDVPVGDVPVGDVVVAEIGTGQLRRATDALVDDGSVTARTVVAAHARPAVSDTGRVVVFDTADASVYGPVGATEGRAVVSVTATPRLSLADLDFGTVLTGWEGDELYVSVLNEGPGAFAPTTITSTSSAFRVVPGGTCTRGLIVPAGGSCTVHMAFNPSRPVPFSGVLTVEEADAGLRATPPPPAAADTAPADAADAADAAAPAGAPGEPPVDDDVVDVVVVVPVEPDTVAVAAVVTGAGGEPVVRFEPAGIDLGTSPVGGPGGDATTRRALDIRNVGTVPTEIASIGLGGKEPGDFVVTAESCTGRALNPRATCTVELELRPSVAARRTATVTATTVTGEYAAAIVSGIGRHEPELHLAADSVGAGRPLGIGLAGFPADTDVALTFDDSMRPFATLRTDHTGGLLAEVTVPHRTRAGERRLVVTAPASPSSELVASATVTVERRPGPQVGVPGHGVG